MMLRRKPRTGSHSKPLPTGCPSSPAPASPVVASPSVLGAKEGDSACERFAFLVIQSPNGEFRRFLIIAAVTVVLVMGSFCVMALLINATIAAWLMASAIAAAGGRFAGRHILKRRRPVP